MRFHGRFGNIHNPDFPDPGSRVNWQLESPIIGKRSVRHFDDQMDIIRSGMMFGVKIRTHSHNSDVRLGF